jgi:hypothetical protein
MQYCMKHQTCRGDITSPDSKVFLLQALHFIDPVIDLAPPISPVPTVSFASRFHSPQSDTVPMSFTVLHFNM